MLVMTPPAESSAAVIAAAAPFLRDLSRDPDDSAGWLEMTFRNGLGPSGEVFGTEVGTRLCVVCRRMSYWRR